MREYLTRAGFLASLGVAGWYASGADTYVDPVRRCITVGTTVFDPPPPPPPVSQGSALPARHTQNVTRQYWVDPVSGSDATSEATARDSSANPWKTLQRADDAIVNPASGDVAINLTDGTHNTATGSAVGDNSIVLVTSGPTSSCCWIWRAASGASPVVTWASSTPQTTFHFQTHYNIVEGLELTGGQLSTVDTPNMIWFEVPGSGGGQSEMFDCYGHDFDVNSSTIDATGIKPDTLAGGTLIVENTIVHSIGVSGIDNLSHGIYAEDPEVWMINCLFYNLPKGYGCQFFATPPNSPWHMSHCTIAGPFFKGPLVYQTATGIDIRNTIFWEAAAGTYMVHKTGSASPSSNTLDHFLCRRAPSDTHFVETPSDWTQTNVDTGNTDPGFVDEANDDYHLTAGADAIGFTDTTWSRPYDIEGHVRPAGLEDAGAFQYTTGWHGRGSP